MKKYLIYDGRYDFDPESAIVMEICDTEEEAEKNKKDHGDGCVVVEEDLTSSNSL